MIAAYALGMILATYNWTKFATISDGFILNEYLANALAFFVENGIMNVLTGEPVGCVGCGRPVTVCLSADVARWCRLS
jgi:hypothetical protein